MKQFILAFYIASWLFVSVQEAHAQDPVELIDYNQDFANGSSFGWGASGYTFFATNPYTNCNSCPGYVAMPVSSSGQPVVSGSALLTRTVTIPSDIMPNSDGDFFFYCNISTNETTTSIAYDILTVELTNGFSSYTFSYSNLDATNSYQPKPRTLLDIYQFAGQTMTLTFTAQNDGGPKTTTFRIDDVSLVVQTYAAPQQCVQWAVNIPPFYAITVEAAEFLCEEDIIESNQDANQMPSAMSKRDIAQYLKNALFGEMATLPSDYYPNTFVDLNALALEYQSAMKMLLYLEYQDGIEPLSRDYFNVLPNSWVGRADAIKLCLEAFNVQPNMAGYNPNSTATSSFYADVLVNHKYYGYLQTASQNGLMALFTGPCLNNPCISPDQLITREEFYVLLYRIIKKYGYPNPVANDFFLPNSFEQANLGNNYSVDRGIFTSYEDESFAISGGGLPLSFAHYYNSLLTEMPFTCYEVLGFNQEIVRQKLNPLGVGWSHSYNIYIQRVPDAANNPTKDIALMIWWPDGTIHSYNTVLNKYNTEGITDKLTILQWDFSNNATKIEIKKKDGTKYTFTSDYPACLKLDEIRDRNGNTITLAYENILFGTIALNRLKSVTDLFSNRAISFQYQTGTCFISSVTDNSGRTVRFDVDKDKRLLTSFTDAKSQKTEYTYGLPPHALGVLTKIKRPNGNYITNEYAKKKLKSSEGNNYKISIDYTPAYSNGWQNSVQTSASTITKDGVSIRTDYKYNYFGNPIEVTRPEGRVTYVYANATCRNSPTKITDEATGIETFLSYDNNCNVILIEPHSATQAIAELFEYDSENQLTAHSDPKGNRTTYVYDSKGNLIKKQQPLGVTTVFDYNANGTLRSINVPDEGITNLAYNTYGNVSQVELSGKTETYTYDAVSRITATTDADGRMTAYAYDNNDNLIKETVDPSGLNMVTSNVYDPNDNLTSVTSPKGLVTTLTYDFNTDALLSERVGTYTKSWVYYEDGSQKSYTNRNLHTSSFLYFSENDTRKGLLKKYGNVEYDYDSKTLYPTSVKEGAKTIAYTNDDFGRVIEISYNDISNNKVGYQYDNNNNVTKRTYPLLNGTRLEVDLVYDALNRLVEVKNSQTGKYYAKYTYRKDGVLLKEELGNGLITEYLYDQYSKPNGVRTYHPVSGTLINLQCQRSNSGKILEETSSYEVPGAISKSDFWSAASNKTYSFDPANRITSTNSKPFIYSNWDLSANAEDTLQYVFDGNERLLSLTNTVSNATISFEYDPLGNRRRSGNTHYLLDLLDNENIIATTDLNGQAQSIFIYGLGLVCRIDPTTGAEYYYHFDWNGNNKAISDSARNLIKGYYYSPFGEDVQAKGTLPFDNPFTYVGKYGIVDDKNGHFYMRARFYHAKTGRFISEDPVWGTNLFPYANNDPVNNIDPDGEFVQFIVGAATSVASGYIIAKLSGVDYSWKDAAGDALLGATGVGLAKAAGTAIKIIKRANAAKGGIGLVYQGIDKGGVIRYVGRTEREATVRFAEHLNSGTAKSVLQYRVVNGATGLSRASQKVWEQTLINKYGLQKNGGLLLNKINSIAPKNWWRYGIK